MPTISGVEASGRPVRRAGRVSPRLVAVLVLVLVVDGAAGLLLGLRLSRPAGPSAGERLWNAPDNSLGVDEPATRRVEAVEHLLDRRDRALTDGDRDAYLSTVDPARPRFRRREALVFDRVDELPVRAWDSELDGRLSRAPRARVTQAAGPKEKAHASGNAEPAWVVVVAVRHRLAGFDTGWASRQVSLTLTHRGRHWYVSGQRALPQNRASGVHTVVVDRSRTAAKDLWQLGSTRVVRGQRTLVVGAGSHASLRQVAQEVDGQIRKVGRFWRNGWSRRVVVLVPRTVRDMAALLGAEPRGLRQIAAVTTGESDPSTGGSVSRVVVNPVAFADLAPLGREIVLAHEVTHVAVRSVTTERVPTWLAEGFADYVAYRGTRLSMQAVAEELFADIHAGRVPNQLPVSSEFSGTHAELAQSYEMAWLACVFVAERYGRQALIDLYRTTGRLGLASGLREALNLSEPELTVGWRDYLVRKAG